jgi:hypothetical protein
MCVFLREVRECEIERLEVEEEGELRVAAPSQPANLIRARTRCGAATWCFPGGCSPPTHAVRADRP